MSAPTFLETLTREVGRMQMAHPEREGELARAHALILHGMVVPSPTDPDTAQVLSSDGQTMYHVNGVCDCTAGLRGKDCKHLHAWKLYRYIAGKMAERKCDQDTPGNVDTQSLPEAPASVNLRAMLGGFEVQITLRDRDETALLARLQDLLKRPDVKPVPKPAARTGNWKKAHEK